MNSSRVLMYVSIRVTLFPFHLSLFPVSVVLPCAVFRVQRSLMLRRKLWCPSI